MINALCLDKLSHLVQQKGQICPDTSSLHQTQQVSKVIWQRAASLPHIHFNSPYTLQWAGLSPTSKVPLPVDDLDPILYKVPWDHNSASETASQSASQSVQPFLQSSVVCPTHKPRYMQERAASTCMHCVQAMRPKNCTHQGSVCPSPTHLLCSTTGSTA